jgi:hypothetical protein
LPNIIRDFEYDDTRWASTRGGFGTVDDDDVIGGRDEGDRAKIFRDIENDATRWASIRRDFMTMDDDGDREARDEDDRAKIGRQVRIAGRGASDGE